MCQEATESQINKVMEKADELGCYCWQAELNKAVIISVADLGSPISNIEIVFFEDLPGVKSILTLPVERPRSQVSVA